MIWTMSEVFLLEAQAAMIAGLVMTMAGGPLPKIEYCFPYGPPTCRSTRGFSLRKCASTRGEWR